MKAEATASRVRLAELEVDLADRSAWRGGERVELPELSFRLLEVLIAHAPGSVGKDELIREVWGDVVVSDETLAQRVRLLRQALKEDSQKPRFIASVRGRGYRLICSVEAASSSQKPNSLRWKWTAAAALIAVVILASQFFDSAPDDTAINLPTAQNVIAVLPFQDLSPDRSHRFFADGMQEELLARLSRLRELSVVSRTSVERYRDSDISLPQIATDLGAATIVEGSVRVDEDKLRITVQLIDGMSDVHIWSKTYDRELSIEGVFEIQREVADDIAKELKLEFAANAQISVELPTNNLDAYNQYLLGRYHTFQQTPDNLELAVTYLGRAIEIDPQFAEAYAALGWAYSFMGTAYGRYAPAEVYPKAKEAALRAIAIDSNLANARTLYADILTWYDWDFVLAEQEYQKTIEIDPLNVLGYALFLSCLERHDEAIALIELRVAAQPDDTYVQVNAGWRYLDAGLYEKAIEAAKLARQHPDAATLLGFAYLAMSDSARALEVFERDLNRQGRNPGQITNLAIVYFNVGRDSEASTLQAELEALSKQRYLSPAMRAAVEFAAGNTDSGFQLLQEAVDVRAREVIFLRGTRMLNGHRDDPRYAALLAAVGL